MSQETSPQIKALISNKKSVALVANGAIHDYALMAGLIRKYPLCVAVDGGLIHCHEMKICPDLIIGDFDSIPSDLLKRYQDVAIEQFSTDKDESDMELAIQAVNIDSIKNIGIFGALEKRLDHSLANLFLACRFPDKIVIETETESIFAINKAKIVACSPGQIVSLIPLSVAKGVSTQGLKWELKNATLDKSFLSLSNVCLSPSFKISVAEGDLLCCMSRNQER